MQNLEPVTVTIHLPDPHKKQVEFIDSKATRVVTVAGRRSGKTIAVSIMAVEAFLSGKRVLYAAPTQDQVDMFWRTVTRSLQEAIDAKIYYVNQTKHIVELRGTEQRIRAKTAWSPDTLRGDYADLLILDEFQMMSEDTWGLVGLPMLLDNNGKAVFIYTPPSLRTIGKSKAKDPQHASHMYKKAKAEEAKAAEAGTESRWAGFHFTSHDNPYISEVALADIVSDMSSLAYRQEILAEDVDEAPGALWHNADIEALRVWDAPDMDQIVVGVDPSASSGGDEAGVIVCGRKNGVLYILDDMSIQGSPTQWANQAIKAYHKWKANLIVAEKNNGGEMVSLTIGTVDKSVPVELVWSSRGKQLRAEPISVVYEKKMAHHVGNFPFLEAEMTLWQPGDSNSPNRLDAMVFSATKLMVNAGPSASEWLAALKKKNAEAEAGY